ncbi:RagB/SusD family nutrient uptake outer membrane protein [Flavobacterium sp. LC2016-12]|uniref:RagB/SusD family nutrient uptake outer membrane protein n=1 Tax=Flavobacterium sp. LC2016-12 TaxID=2783794 RepID=UPI00188C76DD|nr:RagB/SusD family nutrient uptake outer membrane protein [Flavobacterium sp. LC2016-12]MBF4467040.1 RagB/SusD family nutrient uptake outer membrane protein [Flavobacterium sp. LC2016-12]
MKKYTYSKITVLIFGFLSLFGCTDMLDQEPLGLATPQNFWVSQANVESALAGDYALLKEALTKDSNFMLWGEFTGMTFMDSQFWIVDYIEGSGNYVLAYRDDSRNWKGFYRAANWALSIEKHVSEMPDSDFQSKAEKNRLIGEAAFVRSLSYFYLARIWGDAPIVDEVIETSDQLIKDGYIITKPRENELKVLDFALAAANKAISLLDYSTPGAPKWAITANKASAEALKAHITLWYASRDQGNPAMLAQALAAANSVIGNSNASLIDYANEGVDGFNDMCIGQSKTGLFEINISSAMNESYRVDGGDNTMTGLTLTDPFFLNPNSTAPIISDDFYGKDMMNSDSDRDNDKRKELFFSDFDSNEQSSLMKYSQATRDGQSSDPYARFSESNILIFRLADIYLLRAEANMKLGNTTAAVSDLNTIRSKANVPNYTGATDSQSLTKAIFDERAIELVGEGQSGFDRIRMNYYAGVSWMSPSRLSHQGCFWPVDPTIISINPAIVQTDYWKGKL